MAASGGIVYIRFNSNAQMSVPIQPTSSVRSIKEEVARAHGVPASQIRLIFAGHELSGDLTLADCSVQSQSILHAVTGGPLTVEAVPKKPAVAELELAAMQSDPLGNSSNLGSPTRGDDPEAAAKFYVFCKDPRCRGVRPGKLRVRCAKCKESTMILKQDPTCWEDVLTKGKLHGECRKAGGCPGKIAEFYFKCGGHPSEEKDTCVALYYLKTNTIGVECAICCMDDQEVVLVFPCAVGHCVCLGCFHTYGVTSLNNRSFRKGPTGEYSITCAAGCEGSMIKETHHFRLLGDDQYERYQRFATEEFVLENGGVLCPAVNCGNGILPEGRRVECPTCRHVFCKQCKEPFHRGTCGQVSQAPPRAAQERSEIRINHEANNQWERASQQKVIETTRPCPKCGVPIEKNGGCMHMTCSRCHFDWCWLCGTEWGRRCMSAHWFG